jgi:hypothetical protein
MPAPISHSTALLGVLDAVRLMAELPAKSEQEIVERLRAMGYSEVHAEKLNVFVPSAFAWALLKRMGVSAFPNHYIALTRDRREKQLPLEQEHFFTAALQLASQTLEEGWTEGLSRQTFETVIARSAELNAANKALNEGDSLAGASLQPLRVFRFSSEAAGEA